MPATWDDLVDLTRAHDNVLSGGKIDAAVRASVFTSWQRCRSLGLMPDRLQIPYQADADPEGRLLRVAGPVLKQLESSLSTVNGSVILADAQGRVLRRRGGDADLNKSLDAVQLAVGFTFAEAIAGTNGIGTALADRRPCYILGREHFAESMKPFACAGAPLRNPLSGRIEGVLNLTCWRTEADPAMLTLASRTAKHIEQRMLEQTTQDERDLIRAFWINRESNGSASTGTPGARPGPADLLPSIDDVLTPADRALLREKAAELISVPGQVGTEVRLSDGQVATLRCRPVTGPAGQAGVAVEASLCGSSLRGRIDGTATGGATGAVPSARESLLVTTNPRAGVQPVRPRPGSHSTEHTPTVRPAGTTPAETARPHPHTDLPAPGIGTEGWLVLLGDPGVGQLAIKARQRLALLFEAGSRIGTTLDVTRTAEELAEVAVPHLADGVTVDLFEPVLRGEEPALAHDELRRVAMSGVGADVHQQAMGKRILPEPSTPQGRCLAQRQPVFEPVLGEASPGDGTSEAERTPGEVAQSSGSTPHSRMTVPMQARGSLLGVVSFVRSQSPQPFEEDDLCLARELVGRVAVCIDNARRYTREHTMALALQRSLLPQGLRSPSAVEVAHRYLPSQAGVGGDWYDVIPLSGCRVALVVGDVVGHGVHAAATMGRLQTAVYSFSSMDLPVDELLCRLDALVDRLAEDPDDSGVGSGVVGATCLYAVYDPVSRHCTLASAGHPLPALVLPDGTVEFPDVPAGPPLGLGGLPFQTIDLEIPEGSELVLYSDGLIEDRDRDIDVGLSQLRHALAQPSRPPEETCDAVLKALLPPRPQDDVALLVARLHTLDDDRVAVWDVPADPAHLSRLRGKVTEQLNDWDLQELAFSTELLATELVTNAIRHAAGPIQVRLLRDRTLICEVSDGSSTAPRMRQAAWTDEDGRGLFLISQLAAHWGTRYTNTGKVLWAEQPLPQ
jgi:anti-sigma regulatory factor (Ser/Thr protein kinase)